MLDLLTDVREQLVDLETDAVVAVVDAAVVVICCCCLLLFVVIVVVCLGAKSRQTEEEVGRQH